LGPAIIGPGRLSPGKNVRWEAGIFFGLDNQSPDQTIKLNFELEFQATLILRRLELGRFLFRHVLAGLPA
jgi:hypothetical protein